MRHAGLHRVADDFRPGGDLDVSLVPVVALDVADLVAWNGLAQASASANIFARPWFVHLSLRHFDVPGKVQLAIVRAADGSWIGAAPLVFARRYGRAVLPHWELWRHANQFVGTPLVRAGCEADFWSALLAHLDRASPSGSALRVFDLPLDDPVNGGLLAVCGQQRRDFRADRHFERPMLVPGTASVEGIKPKDRRRLASLRRKLEREVGPVTFAGLPQGMGVSEAVARFLELEHSGWKGRQGCSLASAADTAGFFAAVMTEAAREGALDVLSLSAGERIIAMSTHFVGPVRGFGFKMAFDEAFARYAPGLLLLDELTERFRMLDVPEIDSCSAPGQQPVSRMWQGRRELVDGRVALGGPLRRAAFRALGTIEDLRANARTEARAADSAAA